MLNPVPLPRVCRTVYLDSKPGRPMRSYHRTALVCLVYSGLAGPAPGANGQTKDPGEQARVQSMTSYTPPLQRYTVQGIQRDPRLAPASPATQEIVYQNA